MSYIKFLLAVALLSPAAAIGLGSNFKDFNCTGSIQVVRNQQVIPVNFWDIDQSASPFTFHDPEWLNAAMNSTTVPITDGAIEFGFGRIANVSGRPPVNVTVTLDMDTSGCAVYQVACTAPQGAACVITNPFAVLMTINSDSLIGGSYDLLFNNMSDLFAPSFDASNGTFSFETGPLDGSDPVTGGLIRGGGLRQITFQLNEAGRCVQGDCCDTNIGMVKPRGVVCRQPSNQCEAVATCNGRDHTCPDTATAANGRRCLWEPNQSFMSAPCDTNGTSIPTTPNTTSAPPAPLGGWGRCTGFCQEGTCTLDCARGQCCYTSSPLPPPDFSAAVQALGQLSQTVAGTLRHQGAQAGSEGRHSDGPGGLTTVGVEGVLGLNDAFSGVIVPAVAVAPPGEGPAGVVQVERDAQVTGSNLLCWQGN